MAIKLPLRLLLILTLIAAAALAGGIVTVKLYFEPNLPSVEALRDVRLQ
jgi:hypothetical protein